MPEVVSLVESDSDTESAEQDGTCFRTSEELRVPIQGREDWKQVKGHSAKFMMEKYFRSELGSIPEGEPCIAGEQLAMHCPNWGYHGRPAYCIRRFIGSTRALPSYFACSGCAQSADGTLHWHVGPVQQH
jgi:hypothetical protein